MKRVNRYIIFSILLLIFLTGVVLIPLCISHFIRYIDKHSELNDFYNDHSIYKFNPNDNSGLHELSSPISLPNVGRFTIIIFCYDTVKQKTDYSVEVNINANINGIAYNIILKDKSYVKNSFFYKGDYVIDPQIDKSWESDEYTISSNMSLFFSWKSTFEDWNLYVLYTNDLIEEQLYDIKSTQSNALLLFGFDLGFSISFTVVGAIGSTFSLVYILKNRAERKRDNSDFHS